MSTCSHSDREDQIFHVKTDQNFFDLSTIDRLISEKERFLLMSADGSKKIIDSVIMFRPEIDSSRTGVLLLCRGHYKKIETRMDPVFYSFKLRVNFKERKATAILLSPIKVPERKLIFT